MNISINFHAHNYSTTNYSNEIEKLYGISPLIRMRSYNVTLSIPISKEHSRNIEAVRHNLVAAGCDERSIEKIIVQIQRIEEPDDEVFYSKVLETINSELRSTPPSKENSCIFTQTLPNEPLSIVFESVYSVAPRTDSSHAPLAPAAAAPKPPLWRRWFCCGA